jgi:hypothetical protein
VGINTILRVKWSSLKRTKAFYFLIIFDYFLLALVDSKSCVLMPDVESYIYRFVFQQFFIVITSIFFVNLVFNEKTLDSIKNYMIIYVKDIKKEIYGTALLCIIVNVAALIVGQIILLIINYICYGKVLLTLSVVNFTVVVLQIVISILFVMSLRMYFKKDLLVYGLFYISILTLITINNVFITLPLTIKILGIGGEEYYITYGWQLWAGRVILLAIIFAAFRLSTRKLSKEWKNV